MKKLLFTFLGFLLALAVPAFASTVFVANQGGTGTSTPSGILYGDNGSTNHLNTVTIGANCTFSGGTLNCTSSGGTGTVSTSTNETSGTLSYWTSNSATPALLGKVATSSLTATSPLSLSQAVSVIGSAASALSLSTAGTWSGLAGTATALAANGTNCSAGNYPVGVDASGNSEGCTTANLGTVTAVTGTYPVQSTGGATPAVSLAFGTTTANTWNLLQNFSNASSSQFTVTSTLYIPNAASSPALGAGAIALNTTAASSSLRFGDGSATRSLYPDKDSVFSFASSTLQYEGKFGASGTTTILLGNYNRPKTLVNFYCKTDVGTAFVRFGNGTASTTQVQCSTAGIEATGLSNNTWTRRQNFFAELGTSASAPNIITVTADLRDDAD